jgi:hypothetical protein
VSRYLINPEIGPSLHLNEIICIKL